MVTEPTREHQEEGHEDDFDDEDDDFESEGNDEESEGFDTAALPEKERAVLKRFKGRSTQKMANAFKLVTSFVRDKKEGDAELKDVTISREDFAKRFWNKITRTADAKGSGRREIDSTIDKLVENLRDNIEQHKWHMLIGIYRETHGSFSDHALFDSFPEIIVSINKGFGEYEGLSKDKKGIIMSNGKGEKKKINIKETSGKNIQLHAVTSTADGRAPELPDWWPEEIKNAWMEGAIRDKEGHALPLPIPHTPRKYMDEQTQEFRIPIATIEHQISSEDLSAKEHALADVIREFSGALSQLGANEDPREFRRLLREELENAGILSKIKGREKAFMQSILKGDSKWKEIWNSSKKEDEGGSEPTEQAA